MAGTAAGAMKRAATLRGMTIQEYKLRAITEKWCTACREWHPRAQFNPDASRWDGLSAACGAARRARYQPRPRTVQRTLVPLRRVAARDGDVKQARRTVNAHVEAGRWPAPASLPCVDCGHVWSDGERRHEYDHHLGYAAKHHESVEPVCTTCHHIREQERAAA